MDWLNYLFGGVGIVSLIFSVYTYFRTKSKKTIEVAKASMQKERIRNTQYALKGILNSIDAIVQIPKKEDVSIVHLQNLARVARSQAFILTEQLEMEKRILNNWKFGELIQSEVEGLDDESIENN